jgi:hypothetical protein
VGGQSEPSFGENRGSPSASVCTYGEWLEPRLDPTNLVVYRREHVVYHRRVDAREGAALRQVSRGAPFGDVCDSLADGESVDRSAQRAFGALAQWIADGLMARV